MSKISWNKISNWLFYSGIFIGAVGYYRIYKVKSTLPSGVCPVNDNRWMLFLGIFVLLLSVITAYISDWLVNHKVKNQ